MKSRPRLLAMRRRYDSAALGNLLRAGTIDEGDYWGMLRSSQRQFARLTYISPARVNQMIFEGVLTCNCYRKIFTLESFARYFEMYLSPWKQAELVEAAVAAADDTGRELTTSTLAAVFELERAIQRADENRLRCELLLRFIDGQPTALMSAFEKARRRVRYLRRRQQQARERLTAVISAADLPAIVSAVLIARHVDLKEFVTIAQEQGKSRRQIFRYLSVGRAALQG